MVPYDGGNKEVALTIPLIATRTRKPTALKVVIWNIRGTLPRKHELGKLVTRS